MSTLAAAEDMHAMVNDLNFANYLLNQAEKITALGHWQWEVGSNQVFWSDNLYAIYGLEKQKTISYDRFMELIYPPDRKMVQAYIESFLEKRQFREFHHRILTPDGALKVLHARGEVQTDREGNPVRMFGTSQDVTERRSMEQELMRKSEALQSKNEELEQFAFVASHDLQEPLRKLAIFCQRLEQECGAQLNEKGLQYIQKIASCSQRMRELVNGILRLSTFSHPIEFSPVALDTVLKNVLSDLSETIEQTGAQLEIGPLPTIETNEVCIYQVFQNLLTNALKFVRPGTAPQIQVRAEIVRITDQSAQQEAWDQVGRKESIYPMCRQDHCIISISDKGIGFDAAGADAIFSMFNSLHRQNGYKGNGIGLAVVKKIIENHSGRIRVESQPGKGSTFTLLLPLKQQC